MLAPATIVTAVGIAVALVVAYLSRGAIGRAAVLFSEGIALSGRLLGFAADALADALGRRSDLFWAAVLAALGLAIYLPYLGSFPLWDPWEPHYTQVAWEMQERNTWFNPWYRGLDNWWSKPILMLWMLRSSLGLFWDPLVNFGDNEFVARLPFALVAIAGGLLQYHWATRLFGRRVGVLSAVILITAPQYLLIGRQVMVDVPFVATFAASIGYLGVGLFCEHPALAPAGAPVTARLVAWWRRNWPFCAFWSLQAVSMLAKGFVPPALAVLTLAGYFIATFRWRDYGSLTAGRYWPGYLWRRGLVAAALAAVTAGVVVVVGLPQVRGALGALAHISSGGWLIVGFASARTYLLFAAWRGLRDPLWRARFGKTTLAVAALDLALRTIRYAIPDDSPWVVPLLACDVAALLAGVYCTSRRLRDDPETGSPALETSWPLWALAMVGLALAIFAGFGAAFAPVRTSPVAPRELQLYRAMIASAGGVAIALWAFYDLPPSHHALHILQRMRAAWGLPLFLFIGAPWFVYMSFAHGWPYWNEWVFYHHLGRAAGTIDKPGNTFDFYVRQVGFAFFPWSAFLVGALWLYSSRCQPLRSIADRRNIYFLMAAVLPYLFFTLSGTKFAHYIFPVVPFLALMVAAVLVWLGRAQPRRPRLAEAAPPVGPTVPDYAAKQTDTTRTRGVLVVFAALTLVAFAILAHDLALDFRLILRLFIYYYNRATPNAYYPFVPVQVIMIPVGIVMATILVSRRVGRWQLFGIGLGGAVFACYIGWVMMPAMQATYSFKPFYDAYQRLAKPGEDIGQYNDWQQPVRSVIFLFQNRCKHLRTDAKAEAFLKRPGRKFILVDSNRLPDLRRVARKAGKTIYVVFDDHPYGRMVSDQRDQHDARRAADHILTTAPSTMHPLGRLGAEFADKITLLGYELDPAQAHPGQTVQVTFYYRCEHLMDDDWQIFIHGDGPSGGSNRIHSDHFPAGGMYPTTEWQVGEVIRDTFAVPVPPDYPFAYFVLWTGWYRGETRLQVGGSAPSDGNNRVRGPQIRVLQD